MSWLERPACSRVTSTPASLIISGSKVMTVEGRLAPGWLPASITRASPCASFGARAGSSSPSSLLMTVLALFISPSQKNSSRVGPC